MHKAQEQVRDFMRAMGQPSPRHTQYTIPSERAELRLRLIKEETAELEQAMSVGAGKNSEGAYASMHEDVADAICDLLYVTYGMAVEYGIDIEPLFELVHEANMRKGPGPVREDGKKLKPEGWKPPDLREELLAQLGRRGPR